MIKTNNLQKAYNGKLVLDLSDLTINKSEIFGLLGNNGAGKTTFFSLVLDLIKASTGNVSFNDVDVSKSESWKEQISSYIDESFTIGYLTPDEYFNFIGELRYMNKKDVALFLDKFKDFFKDEIIGKKKYIRNLSKGNQKKVGVVGALMGNTDLVLLDEPFANLDPSSQFQLREIIKQFAAEQNKTFLISSHNLDNITDVCNRIVVLEKGKIVKDIRKTESTLKELEDFFIKK